ncbi:alpha/beta hydrolase fold domain-containing protein [Qipengyuania sp. ASV99]|uniref:alpha/beta hydrolase n=1 Tax=Qipengyuania sp. ASV99 TaxID=3399681 RepID=UPI003A4C5C70
MKMNRVALLALVPALYACGGGDSSPAPVVGSSPTPSPTPTPSPSPTPTPTPSSGFVRTADIVYGAGPTTGGQMPLFLDFYSPDASCASPRPTVIFVHGGGFVGGSRRGANVEAIAQELNQRGINLASIQYRLQGDMPQISAEFASFENGFRTIANGEPSERITAFTAAVEDAVRALRWTQDNADQYCIQPDRIGLWGSSAGAYTVLHAAYSLDEFSIQRPAIRVVVDYWGGLFRDTDLEANEPPLFILHGTSDATVPFSEATELTERADGVGTPVTLYSVIGGGHDFNGSGFFEVEVDGQSIAAKTAEFVSEHLRDGGSPVYEKRELQR